MSRAMIDFSQVGAAVCVVHGSQRVLARGFGRRHQATKAPVSERTAFQIGSLTTSMTTLLIAAYIERGLCTWATPVVQLWPKFAAPTRALTRSLTVADLFGMGTGLAEPPNLDFFAASGEIDAGGVLDSLSDLPITAKPGGQFHFNGALAAALPYLIMLSDGTALRDLERRYAEDMQTIMFAPMAMSAHVGADRRENDDDFAYGYSRDLRGNLRTCPFVSLGGYAPVGSVSASATDMANYLITHLRSGVAPSGTRVVGSQEIMRVHQPGVAVTPSTRDSSTNLDVATGPNRYAMGWFEKRFNSGQRCSGMPAGWKGSETLLGSSPSNNSPSLS